VKLYVKAQIGNEYNVPTIAILRSIEEAMNYNYPSRCCIKPAHLSGPIIMRLDNETLNLNEIARWISESHYINTRELNYKALNPKIIVEPIIFDNDNLNDYKYICYKGRPKLIQVDLDRYKDHKRKIFNIDWQEMSFCYGFPNYEGTIPKPRNFDDMLNIAAKLSSAFDFIRVDLYTNGSTMLVGELTNTPGNAEEIFVPISSEKEASRIIFG
jgi:TupA-like ATPgrasp